MPKTKNVMDFTSKAGNKFVFQKVGAAQWLDSMDEVEVNGVVKRAKLYPMVLQHVVVQPTLSVADFDGEEYGGYAELEEVATAAMKFQQGK